MKEIVRYDELQKGDVVYFYGAKVRITDARVAKKAPANEYYPNDDLIRFDIEPADEEALKILGGFYSHGTYGGVGSLKITRIS